MNVNNKVIIQMYLSYSYVTYIYTYPKGLAILKALVASYALKVIASASSVTH